jgi:hypothetical protein
MLVVKNMGLSNPTLSIFGYEIRDSGFIGKVDRLGSSVFGSLIPIDSFTVLVFARAGPYEES